MLRTLGLTRRDIGQIIFSEGTIVAVLGTLARSSNRLFAGADYHRRRQCAHRLCYRTLHTAALGVNRAARLTGFGIYRLTPTRQTRRQAVTRRRFGRRTVNQAIPQTKQGRPVLEAKDLVKVYELGQEQIYALNHIDLQIMAG